MVQLWAFNDDARNQQYKMRMEGFKKVHEDLERVIEKDDSGSSMSGSEEGKPRHGNHRDRIAHVMHSTKFQILIIALVILDCILVISELLIDCHHEQNHGTELAAEVLHFMSIGILSIFIVEIIVKLYAMGLSFFKHKLEVFDALIVFVSFALDIAFMNDEDGAVAGSLLIILRLWRVARIMNAILMSVKIQAERKVAREGKLRGALEHELSKYRQYCSEQEQEIEALQKLLNENGIEFTKNERPVMGSQLSVVAEVNNPSSLQEVDLSVTHS